MFKILTFTTLFPNKIYPNNNIFIKERMSRVAKYCPLRIVAPIPFFPKIIKIKKWFPFTQIPRLSKYPEFTVYHPRYFITPKIGMIFYGLFLFVSVIRLLIKVRNEYNFDIIDSHYIYPDGLAAVLIGKVLQKPVVVSARGTDINLYPRFPFIRKQIIFTLKRAKGVIAVCQALKDQMIELGVSDDKITVIPNGVDANKFFPISQKKARERLNLPLKKQIILSVGNLIERKGFHFIIEALNIIKNQYNHEVIPLLVIVGEGEYREVLERKIHKLNLKSDVILTGSKPHEQLNDWYNACDIYCLASSREGWPNVLFEALACGKPVVATNVWGVSEVIKSPEYGILVDFQSPDKLSEAFMIALKHDWNHERMVEYAQKNDWDKVALKVINEFSKAIK